MTHIEGNNHLKIDKEATWILEIDKNIKQLL
jgi:hypothetical protein